MNRNKNQNWYRKLRLFENGSMLSFAFLYWIHNMGREMCAHCLRYNNVKCEVVVKWAQAQNVRQKSSLQVLFDIFAFFLSCHSFDSGNIMYASWEYFFSLRCTLLFHGNFVLRKILMFPRNIIAFIIITDSWCCDDLERMTLCFVIDIKMYWIRICR